jgi:hypothetical protein
MAAEAGERRQQADRIAVDQVRAAVSPAASMPIACTSSVSACIRGRVLEALAASPAHAVPLLARDSKGALRAVLRALKEIGSPDALRGLARVLAFLSSIESPGVKDKIIQVRTVRCGACMGQHGYGGGGLTCGI